MSDKVEGEKSREKCCGKSLLPEGVVVVHRDDLECLCDLVVQAALKLRHPTMGGGYVLAAQDKLEKARKLIPGLLRVDGCFGGVGSSSGGDVKRVASRLFDLRERLKYGDHRDLCLYLDDLIAAVVFLDQYADVSNDE